jgi:hypothetical protein
MVKRKKVARKVAKKTTSKNATEYNKKALWKAYKELQMRADKAWEKFRNDVRKNARSDVLVKDHTQLVLLMAECNYMARECMRMSSKMKKRK